MLNLPKLHPHQLRHGGATEELTSRLRAFNQIKARGRWMTDQSVRRYAKVGRVQDLPNKMSPSQTRYCQWSEKNMERVFLGQVMINPEDVSWPDVFTIHDRPRRFCLELFAGTAMRI